MVFCIAGTEEETGGDGAGEVSTSVESESVVRRRRAVGTRRLVPLAGGGGGSIVFLRPTQAKLGVDSCWGRRSMRVYLVPNESYSSITPHLLHVCDSFFLVLDQYSGDPSSYLIQATGHQLVSLYRSVVEEEKNQLLGPLMTSQYSETVPYDSVILRFHYVLFCCQSLMRCWTSSTRGHPRRISSNVCLTRRTPVGRKLMSISLGDGCAPDSSSK